jgi:hypothetical protein
MKEERFVIICNECGKVQQYLKRIKTDITKQRKKCISCNCWIKVHSDIGNQSQVITKTEDLNLVKDYKEKNFKGERGEFYSYK